MIMFLLNAFLMAVFPSYRVDFPVQKIPAVFSYAAYHQGQHTVKKTINATDATHLKLKSQLLLERHGWRYDVISYVPNKVFSSPAMTINCMGRSMVVNVEVQPGNWVQISKDALHDVCPAP